MFRISRRTSHTRIPHEFETAPWRRSGKRYKKYLNEQNSVRLRKVFEELVFTDACWSSDSSQVASSFEAAAAEADLACAQMIGAGIIENQKNLIMRGAIRLVLAARAALVHDNIPLADWLIEFQRQRTKESLHEAQMERLLLTMRCPAAAESNQRLFEALARNPRSNGYQLANEWIKHRWLFEGPTPELLRAAIQTIENFRFGIAGLRLLERALALAFRVKDMNTVDSLLASYPVLTKSYDHVLPLAAYLRSNGLNSEFSAERARILEHAELYEQLNLGASMLIETLADRGRTIAIVGNSPCEIGSGKGAFIDGHDTVVRFNRFSTTDQFAGDYGKKCSIHVRRPARSHRTAALSSFCRLAVLHRADVQYRLRTPDEVVSLLRDGIQPAAPPPGSHHALYGELKTQPSAGLTFCSVVRSLRGRLPRESCFGFSFVDQIEGSSGSAHYFEKSLTNFKHYWPKEKTIFDRLLSDGEINPGQEVVASA